MGWFEIAAMVVLIWILSQSIIGGAGGAGCCAIAAPTNSTVEAASAARAIRLMVVLLDFQPPSDRHFPSRSASVVLLLGRFTCHIGRRKGRKRLDRRRRRAPQRQQQFAPTEDQQRKRERNDVIKQPKQ